MQHTGRFYFGGVEDEGAGRTIDDMVKRRQSLPLPPKMTNHNVMLVARRARVDIEPFTVQLPAIPQECSRRVGQGGGKQDGSDRRIGFA